MKKEMARCIQLNPLFTVVLPCKGRYGRDPDNAPAARDFGSFFHEILSPEYHLGAVCQRAEPIVVRPNRYRFRLSVSADFGGSTGSIAPAICHSVGEKPLYPVAQACASVRKYEIINKTGILV